MAKTGSFDLNFPGAKMVCDSPQKRASLLKYLNGESNSYAVDLTRQNFDLDVEIAIYNTTYIHESKHFYDHLLCPYLLHNYALKVYAFYYAILAINEWNKKQPYKYIPLPFVSWLKLPFKEKLEILNKKGINKKDVPLYSFKQALLIDCGKEDCKNLFTKYLLKGAAHYAEYWDNSKQYAPEGGKTDYSLKSFTESMAYVQHMAEIMLRYGDEYGGKMVHKIMKNSFGFTSDKEAETEYRSDENANDYIKLNEYTAAFSMILELERYSNVDPKWYYPFASYVLFWSLSGFMGNSSLINMHPRNRLEGLYYINKEQSLHFDSDEVLWSLIKDPLTTFAKWDELVNPLYEKSNESVKQFAKHYAIDAPKAFKSFENFYAKYVRQFSAMSGNLNKMGLFWPSFYIYNLNDSLINMATIFLQEPGRYLYPEEYSKNINMFPNVPYRFEFQDVPPIREEECAKARKGTSWIGDYIYGDSLVKDKVGFYDKKMDYRAFDICSEYINFSDALYGSANINMPGMLVKKFLPGVKTWFF